MSTALQLSLRQLPLAPFGAGENLCQFLRGVRVLQRRPERAAARSIVGQQRALGFTV